ncbi:YjzC family protein [Halobacillus sp. BBL2006]|uniref:YjzC family protein n=1 Tax=Halobacillus sp. BBL2006 TaxID=1543706 RepID=UPI0009E02A76|nr:YjzC family protein [Halobacillus sp. BBL2006]
MADRYKTGEKAPQGGTYKFDGLVDGVNERHVTEDEKHIEWSSGETFPSLRPNKEAAYWKKSNSFYLLESKKGPELNTNSSGPFTI